jgi:hypothetical protein
MRLFDEMTDKYGFEDGGAVLHEAEHLRQRHVDAVNGYAKICRSADFKAKSLRFPFGVPRNAPFW